MWLTTQTSFDVRQRTDTGSTPTGTSNRCTRSSR
jgi:hypothetical protein